MLHNQISQRMCLLSLFQPEECLVGGTSRLQMLSHLQIVILLSLSRAHQPA